MKICFMGTPDFAKIMLQRLYEHGHEIVGVFTQPDRPKSRGMKISFSSVKALALEHKTPVFQPASLRGEDAISALNSLDFDLIAVVAYGKLIPDEILLMPRLGAINIHASLLPKYRGAAPIQRAILNGESETGVTSMYITSELDAGDIILSSATEIGGDETSGELFQRLSGLGANLLCETVDAIGKGNAPRLPQKHDEATYAPMLGRELSPIDWNETAFKIKCKVRGLNPWPTATTVLRDTVYKVYSVDLTENKTSKQNGDIVSTGKHGIEVACSDGTVIIKELQAPGGKRMSAADHIKGNPF